MPSNRFDDINTSSVDSFFAHHGIKGQKWGVRRYQNADGTLTDEGRKRYSKGEGKKSSNSKDKKPKTIADEIAKYSINGKKGSGYKIDPRLQLGKEYTVRDDVIKYYMNIDKTVTDPIREHDLKFEVDKNRKQFKTGAIAAAGGALAIETGIGAAYGVSGAIPGIALGAGLGAGVGAVSAASIGIAAASRVHKANKADKQLESVISEINSNKKVDKKTGLKLIQGEHSEDDDLSKVNPGYKNFSETTKNNCMLCTTTYDLRRRGYDVTVNGANDGYYEGTMMSWYKGNAKLKVLESSSSTSKKYKELQALPEGSRGNLCVQWKQGGGHSMFFEIKDGGLVIRDGQTNKTYTGGKAKQILSETGMCKYVRLDNLDPNIPAMKKSGVFYTGEMTKKIVKHSDAVGISFDDILDATAFIEHHGIKGQKWGVRRYQNLDGTLTEEGKKRYTHAIEVLDRAQETVKQRHGKTAMDIEVTKPGLHPFYNNPHSIAKRSAKRKELLAEEVKEYEKNEKEAYAQARKEVKDPAIKKLISDNVTELFDVKRFQDKLNKAKTLEEIYDLDNNIESVLEERDANYDKWQKILSKSKDRDTFAGEMAEHKLENMRDTDAFIDRYKAMVWKREDELKKNLSHAELMTYRVDSFFAHSGIKGQKWGLRRFQYTDGSLTPEGRKRYLKGGDRAVRKAEKIQSKREKILSDRKKLYKHRNEFSKEELDKAMERFASQDRLREQMQASKEAKRQERAENKRSRLEFKRLKMQQKQMKEQEKQAKLATEQKKLETEQKNDVTEAQTKAAKWRERANKARSIYDFAKVGKDILSDMGITSKEGNESLFGAIAEAAGIKDNSKAKAAAERKKRMTQETEDLNLEKLRWSTQTAKATAMKSMRSLNEDAPEPSKDTSTSNETKNETSTSTAQTPKSSLSAFLGSGSSSSNDEIPHVKGEFVKPKKEKKEKQVYNGFVDILDPEQAQESFGSVPMNEVFAIMKSKGYI